MSTAREVVLRRARESASTIERFFTEENDRIVACARALARAFDAGARLFTMGNGGSACDAQHAAVEFMHPIFAKRPAIPALALTTDTALLTAIGNDHDFAQAYSAQLRVLARPGDVALAISTSGQSASVNRALASAGEIGLIRVGFIGRDGGRMRELCDHAFVAPSFSIHRIQEVHTTLLHVLWDLVHIERGEEDLL